MSRFSIKGCPFRKIVERTERVHMVTETLDCGHENVVWLKWNEAYAGASKRRCYKCKDKAKERTLAVAG
jgi:hypothetical protein